MSLQFILGLSGLLLITDVFDKVNNDLVVCVSVQVHKKLGNTHLALTNFSWATDLDPKGTNNHIKEALDKRCMVDDDDADDNSSNLCTFDFA